VPKSIEISNFIKIKDPLLHYVGWVNSSMFYIKPSYHTKRFVRMSINNVQHLNR